MGRYRFTAYQNDRQPRYVVLCDQWQVLACQRLEPGADLSGAMAAVLDQLAVGRMQQAEGSAWNMVSFSSAARVSGGW